MAVSTIYISIVGLFVTFRQQNNEKYFVLVRVKYTMVPFGRRSGPNGIIRTYTKGRPGVEHERLRSKNRRENDSYRLQMKPLSRVKNPPFGGMAYNKKGCPTSRVVTASHRAVGNQKIILITEILLDHYPRFWKWASAYFWKSAR